MEPCSLPQPVRFGDNLPGFLVGMESLPGVLLVSEWWGVTDIVKMQATMIANEGFRVLIPDLYKGTVGADREEAGHLMSSLDYVLATKEIAQAARYLKNTGSPKVGIVGGCMGGALAFAAAQHVPDLSVAVPLYGTPDAREFQVDQIKISVQYHTGELDNIIGFADAGTARKVEKRMKAAGCDIELHIYERTPHSFLNALVPGGREFLAKYDYQDPPQDQVELCFRRIIEFLNRHLR